MKTRITLLMMLITVAIAAVGQDVQTVMEQLKKKYSEFYVTYESDNGGWFKVAKTERVYNANRTEITKVIPYYGACDKNGRELIPPAWKTLSRIGNMFIVTNKNGWYGVRGLHNEEILPCNYSTIMSFYYKEYDVPCFTVQMNKKWGLYNLNNRKLVVPCIYDEIDYDIRIAHFILTQNDYKGICNNEGRIMVAPNLYTTINTWYAKSSGGYFLVKIGDKGGAMDKNFKLVIPCEYDLDTGLFLKELMDSPLMRVEKNEKDGVYDISKQKEVVPCIYDDIDMDELRNGNSFIIHRPSGAKGQPGKVGIFDGKELKEILPCGKYPYIKNYNKEKQTVIVCKGLEYTYDEDNDKYTIRKQGKWGVYDLKKKKEIVPCKYDLLKQEEDGVYAFNKGCVISIKDDHDDFVYYEGGKWGYIDAMCNEIVAPQYDRVFDFKDGVAQVVKDGVNAFLEHPLKGTSLKLANGGDGSPIDKDIPTTSKKNENLFAFIIANENYTNFKGADYSINDGKVFAEYCKKTLGVPERNVRYYEDATYGNMLGAVKKLQDIADVYEGDAQIIFYYSGLGATDEKTTERYLLSTDASMLALDKTGYEVKNLLSTLNSANVQNMWVVIDAPFSNLDKNGQPLTANRGVAIKAKDVSAEGKTIVTMSCDGNQTAYSSKDYGHSLFTYALLEKLQQSKGNCTIKEMTDYATSWVKKNAMSAYDKMQTPKVIVSDKISAWDKVKF